MKIHYEIVTPDTGYSFRSLFVNEPTIQHNWEYHYHPEIELVCVLAGSGVRHVGYHRSTYLDGDLVLIGKNTPHSGFGAYSTDPHQEIVLQFEEKKILPDLASTPELVIVQQLFQKAIYGILFPPEIKQNFQQKLISIFDKTGANRWSYLIETLFELAHCENFQLLNKKILPHSYIHKHQDRIQTIFTYVEHYFDEDITPQQIANLCSMTTPAFCNFFKKTTQLTLSEFVNKYRINKACQFISEGYSAGETSYKVGFKNISYFNARFKQYVGKTPSDFKRYLMQCEP